METTMRFQGFAFQVGGNMIAQIVVLQKDSWEPAHVNIPIFLTPGEEPTEERILAIIKDGYQRLQEYRQPFQAFEDKYLGKEIIFDPEEQTVPA